VRWCVCGGACAVVRVRWYVCVYCTFLNGRSCSLFSL
jgi:hypothetical protein